MATRAFRSCEAALLGASLMAAAPCSGQQAVQLVPFVGAYVPTRAFTRVSGTCPGGAQCGSYAVTQDLGGALGLRVVSRVPGRVGATASFVYAFYQVSWPPVPNGVDYNIPQSLSAHAWIGSLGLLFPLRSVPSRFAPYITAGLSWVSRGGDVYSGRPTPPPSDWGGYAGLGVAMARGAHWRLHIDLTDLVDAPDNASRQHTFLLSLGLSPTNRSRGTSR